MFEIRRCTAGDFDEVFSLLKQLWPNRALDPAATRASYDTALQCSSQTFVCATEDRRLIAFASLSIKNNLCQGGYMAYIDELVVESGHRRKGVGTRLVERLTDLAKRRDCRRIVLDSAYHRKEAHAFYEKNGFENHGYLFSKML